jgi:hypothetical protein
MSTASIVALFAAAGITGANAASVAKMSLEKFVDVAPPYWQVDVTCGDSNAVRAMHRPIEDEAWCAADAKELCDINKYSLSRKLCDDSLTNVKLITTDASKTQATIKSQTDSNNAPKASGSSLAKTASKKITREALLNEQVQIEEQRILIGQKKLELRRQELTLQKSQLDNK